jgi:hypothetical protein
VNADGCNDGWILAVDVSRCQLVMEDDQATTHCDCGTIRLFIYPTCFSECSEQVRAVFTRLVYLT